MLVANKQHAQPIKQINKLIINGFLRPKASEIIATINLEKLKPNINKATDSWVNEIDVCKLCAIAGKDGKYKSDETPPIVAKKTANIKINFTDFISLITQEKHTLVVHD